MIYIKCKKCGWHTPFSSNIDGFTAKNRLAGYTTMSQLWSNIDKKRKNKEK